MDEKKRKPIPFDDRYFEKQSSGFSEKSAEEKFSYIYRNAFWKGGQSVSGEGSSSDQTETIRLQLPEIIKRYNIASILDIPCGDFNWMKDVDLNTLSYTGADIVQDLIDLNNQNYSGDHRTFLKLDVISDPLPKTDLIFCRDCFVHLSNGDILKALENIRRSKSTYLCTTTFPGCPENKDIVTGDWRIINLQKEPFRFPDPHFLLNENCTEGDGTYSDKSLGLWRLSDL
jgi:hypothetical protein